MRARSRHYVWAAGGMLLGSVVILGGVIALNEMSDTPARRDTGRTTQMQVQRRERPKPEREVQRPRPKPKPKRNAPPPPDLSNLTGGLQGVDVGLSALDLGQLDRSNDLLGDTGSDVAMTSDTVDDPPRPVGRGSLDYPPELRRRGVEGYVLLSLLINAEGEVETVKVVEATPAEVFDRVAIESVRDWRFEPGVYKGKKVKTWVQQRITFELS